MVDDVTFSQVSKAEYTAGVLLEMFLLLGIYIFGPWFYYKTFLVSNKMIDWYLMKISRSSQRLIVLWFDFSEQEKHLIL